ncbi:baseplate J/gp47 family protein [Anaerotruncus rubiinfantis]|uniref:baseplate J/gp47 family protein n=1 Tax=Anaerotruncus rubiinfantis TaxID=1720200 RepID=UPI0034A1681C
MVQTRSSDFAFQNDSRIQTVTNASAAMDGTDPKSDESRFPRIDSSRKKLRTSGNAYDYEAWACEVSGVGYAKCTPIQYGPGTDT